MVEGRNSKTFETFSSLRRFAREEAGRASREAAEAALERCDLCGEGLPPDHRHLLEIQTREMVCACRPCSILFDSRAASEGRYLLVRDRRLFLRDFELDDARWDALRVPVEMAFFFHSTPAGGWSPTTRAPWARRSRCSASGRGGTWRGRTLCSGGMARDVEALLVNRVRGAREHYLVPIDECYRLVGLIRQHWRGLSGGREVWERIEEFFEGLRARSRPVGGGDRPGILPAAGTGTTGEERT